MDPKNENRKLRMVLVGAAGRMGKTIVRCLAAHAGSGLRLVGAIDRADGPDCGKDAGVAAGVAALGVTIGADLRAVLRDCDVVVDFSAHDATPAHAQRAAEAGKALVIGTTGLSAEERRAVEEAARRVPVVMTSNMSVGMNLLFSLVEQAAAALRDRGYDVEVVERHHRLKKDAPSGTALTLGEAAAKGYGWDLGKVAVHGRQGLVGARPAEQIGFHAVRGGDIVGDHTVMFAAEGEVLELSHRATSREAFARGALTAAAWVVGRPPGLYSMRDVLGI